MSDHRSREPLNPDEAAMAQRLRSLPSGAPSATVDAALLAASRAPPAKRPRPTWIAGIAAAASLVLVIGLVSRLPTNMQPTATPPFPAIQEDTPSTAAADALRDQAEEKSEVRSAAEPSASPAAPAQDTTPADIQADAAQSQSPRPGSQVLTKITVSGSRLPADADENRAPDSDSGDSAPEATISERARTDTGEGTTTPLPAARAARKATAPPTPSVSESAAPMAIEVPPAAPPPPPAPPAPAAFELQGAMPESPTATGRTTGTAFAGKVPCDELNAIRDLLSQDQREAAGARLRVLMEKYPEWKVPDDLRSLIE